LWHISIVFLLNTISIATLALLQYQVIALDCNAAYLSLDAYDQVNSWWQHFIEKPRYLIARE
jgi:hypothetical protein